MDQARYKYRQVHGWQERRNAVQGCPQGKIIPQQARRFSSRYVCLEWRTMIEDKNNEFEIKIESKKNKFDLFDYLKNHDAIVIALVTALVTITTTILNMAVYLYDKAYLHYFHVDAVNIKTHEGTLYLIVASIIWVFLIIFSTNNLSKQNDLYFIRLKITKYYKLYLKKKTLSDQQKEILIAAQDKNVVKDKPKILRAALFFDFAYAFLIFVAGLFIIDYRVATWFWLLVMVAFMSIQSLLC